MDYRPTKSQLDYLISRYMNVVQFSKIQRNDVVVGRRRDGERDVGMVGGDQM